MLQDQDLIAVQEARTKVETAYAAWEKYRSYSQDQIDAIVEQVAATGRANAQRLAEMAVEETGYGNVPDKIAKNLLCADFLPSKMRGMKTVGVLRELPEEKIVEIGVPMGVVAAVIPTTNPTSTVIYKALVSLKAGNAVVLSPHPRAKNCTCHTADLLYRSAVQAGAPEGLLQCLATVTLESTQALMRHPKTAVILATGGHGLVKAAYSSGKPAFGVGPGNVPVLVEKSADVADAVARIIQGKSFDYGTVCSSEQTLVSCKDLKPAILEELKKNKAYLCNATEAEALGRLLITAKGTVNPECVGQSPTRIAQLAGFEVPPDTSIITAEIQGVGPEHPLSREKLSPILALYFGEDFNTGMDTCEAILRFGGLGHTCTIFSKDEARIREFGARMPANRVLVNTASPQGSVGLTTNVFPSMTLGCGAAAGNSTGDNVGPQHLINIKRIAYRVREAEDVLQIPDSAGAATQPPAQLAAPPVAAAPAPASSQPALREAVEAAVEQYLKERNLSPAPPAASGSLAGVAEEVVDRFLAARNIANPPQAPSGSICTSCSVTPENPPGTPASPAEAPEPVPLPEPPIQVAEFVCEQDVREAIETARKIFIGPKTIVTPLARELANQNDILVLSKRS